MSNLSKNTLGKPSPVLRSCGVQVHQEEIDDIVAGKMLPAELIAKKKQQFQQLFDTYMVPTILQAVKDRRGGVASKN